MVGPAQLEPKEALICKNMMNCLFQKVMSKQFFGKKQRDNWEPINESRQ
jgi:hypothetical protein